MRSLEMWDLYQILEIMPWGMLAGEYAYLGGLLGTPFYKWWTRGISVMMKILMDLVKSDWTLHMLPKIYLLVGNVLSF